MLASEKGHADVVKLLLQNGANKDAKDKVSISVVQYLICAVVCLTMCMYLVWCNRSLCRLSHWCDYS